MTVEESNVLSTKQLLSGRPPRAEGVVEWKRGKKFGGSLQYSLDLESADPTVVLRFGFPTKGRFSYEVIRQVVHLRTTAPHFGGERWWFLCPMALRHGACNRRVGKLYLPNGFRQFGCRRCHDLTYRSSQLSHQNDRLGVLLMRQLGLRYEMAAKMARRLNRTGGDWRDEI